MTRDDIIAELLRHRAELEAEGVAHLYLFGSFARGDNGPTSDVDLFFDPGKADFSILDYAGIVETAKDILPFKADLHHRGSLRPRVRARAEADAVRVF
jgi:predicted nucleotidyltransferase